MKRKRSKKGELTSTMLVTIILLLVGFGAVLFIFWQISWTGRIDKEVCHESVILRATMPTLSQSYAPLKCRTNKICITASLLGKCEEFEGLKGVTRTRVNDVEDIEKVIAQETLDCWNMMGEGKVSLFTQYFAKTSGFGQVYPTCVMCSKISLDMDSLEEKGITKDELKKLDIMQYMMAHKVPGKEKSYYEFLSGGVVPISRGEQLLSEFESTKQELIEEVKEEDKEAGEELQLAFEADLEEGVDTVEEKEDWEVENNIGILFMQISSPGQLNSLKNLALVGGTSTIGSFVTAPTLSYKAAFGLGKAIASHPIVAAVVAIVGISTQQGLVAWNRGITAGYCGEVAVGEESRNGCSVVKVINYDAKAISDYCSVIESIP